MRSYGSFPPRRWPRPIRSAILHVISLAQASITYTRGWAANSRSARVRLRAKNDRLRQEVLLLQEEIRIKDGRMASIDPHRRPHYTPLDRMAILELRAARGWTALQVATTFGITAATISNWMGRLDEGG